MVIKTKYDFGDKVRILPLDKAVGKIVGIHLSPVLTEYRARYFINGEQKLEYFESDELQAIKATPTGFHRK